jgi:glycogen debranching enzyme
LVSTLTSIPAELLETRLFDSLSEKDKVKYLSAIVKNMYGPDFLTDVGIRSRALRYHELIPFWDYQGSKVSWIVTSSIFAIGLRRQGFVELAEDLENRLLNGARLAEALPEYFYVDVDGRVNYPRYHTAVSESSELDIPPTVVGTNIPERVQAWSVSALLAILLRREKPLDLYPMIEPSYWQRQIELDIFEKVTKINSEGESEPDKDSEGRLLSFVDQQQARILERAYLERFGYED